MSEREKPEECDCCGFETEDLTFYEGLDTKIAGGGRTVKDDFWFCGLCASTPASTRYRYCDEADALKTMCYVGNTILAALALQDESHE
jgi:hypothetical protein